jgi:hypothetical protein
MYRALTDRDPAGKCCTRYSDVRRKGMEEFCLNIFPALKGEDFL